MTQFSLPSDAVAAIAPLGRLDVSEAKKLAAELERGITTSFSFAREVNLVVDATNAISLDAKDRDLLADAIIGLQYLKSGLSSDSNESFVRDLVAAVQANGANPLTTEELAALAANATTFMALRSLRASVKAYNLRADQGSVFLRSQIFTDIRPVFDDALDQPLLASLLTHTIKISFQANNNKTESFFLAADSDDLRMLQKDIDRALQKATVLSRLIGENTDRFGPALDQEESE